MKCRGVDLIINIGKTEVKEELRVNVNVGGQTMRLVRSFSYFG